MKSVSQKIAVIGGSGKSGTYVVRQLIREGFYLKLLLRDPQKLPIESPFIEIVQGDARDLNAVRLLVDGCQAVISTLGQPKGEAAIFSQASRNVIRAMHDLSVRRYILTTGLNVDTPGDRKGSKSRMATDWMKANYPETTSDKQVEFEVLSESGVDWTLVRLPWIELTEELAKILVTLEDCPGDKVSAAGLALFLVSQLAERTYIRKAPFIANV